MLNRQKIAVASLLVAFTPFLPGVAAGGANAWAELPTTQSWEYSDHRVERLSTSSNTLMKFGDALVRVDRADSCNGTCTLRDLSILGNGGAILVSDVPTIALDEQKVLDNDGRLVYAEFTNDGTRVNVVEVDLATGLKTNLIEDVFITDAEEVDISVDGEMIYAEVTFDHSLANELQPQSSIYVYNPRYRQFEQLYHQWRLQREELMDVENGKAIVKMTFPTGEEQLWVYDYVEFGEQSATAVPGSWTPDVEDMVAGHFTKDHNIEFFRMYARTVATMYNGHVTDQVETYTQYLNWYREYDTNNLSNIVQVNGAYMAFVDPENELWVSNGETVIGFGNIGSDGTFTLLDDKILFGNGVTGGVATLAGVVIATLEFTPTDIYDDVVVGESMTGDVMYMNLSSGKTLTLGFGSAPKISDDRHVYWKGEDARLYQATIYVTTAMDTAEGTPVKVAGSPEVYVLVGDTVAYIPNEIVYFTWFDSFNKVVTISADQLATYETEDAVGLKPGTKVRVSGGSKIYVVGSDGELHWIVNEAVAIDLFGSDWDKNILSLTTGQVVDYGYGATISSGNDMAKNVMIATVK